MNINSENNNSNVSESDKIDFVCSNINEIKLQHRKEVLQIILGSNIDSKKIREKGGGTQIKMKDIPSSLITVLYNYIKHKIDMEAPEIHI